MPFVQRQGGVVSGVFSMRQPGIAEEELPDGHADILAFYAPKPRDAKEAEVVASSDFSDIQDKLMNMTPAAWKTVVQGATLAQLRSIVEKMGLAMMLVARKQKNLD